MKDSKFKSYDNVRIRQGTIDPNFNIDIGGCTGHIGDIDLDNNSTWLCEVLFDRETIEGMSDKHIRKCDKMNLNHEIIYLDECELELELELELVEK
jgi:hypothetical protein